MKAEKKIPPPKQAEVVPMITAEEKKFLDRLAAIAVKNILRGVGFKN